MSSVQAVLPALGHRTDDVNFTNQTRRRTGLQTAGFKQVHAWLQPEPTPLAPGEPLEAF